MKKVFVYQDYIHNNGVLFRRLRDTFGAENIFHCDASDILAGCLDQAALFVMPGGADLFYCEKLNGAGNQVIRSYIENGGTYLGICAGAYYACTRIEWAQDEGHQAICGDRELGFFAGTAIGPIYSFLEDEMIGKSWDNVVVLGTSSGPAAAFYNAGPIFIPDEGSTHETLATFDALQDQPAAIVSMSVGRGRAVLSSCHIEYTPALLAASHYAHRNASSDWTRSVLEDFRSSWTPQTDLWNRIVPSLTAADRMQEAA